MAALFLWDERRVIIRTKEVLGIAGIWVSGEKSVSLHRQSNVCARYDVEMEKVNIINFKPVFYYEYRNRCNYREGILHGRKLWQ